MKNALFLLLALGFLTSLQAAESPEGSTVTGADKYATPLSAAVEIVYVPTSYLSYAWQDGSTQSNTLNGFRVNFEWIPFGDMPYGKPVIGVGAGFSWISNVNIGQVPSDLFVVPVEPYLGYRLDYFKNQILVPYGKIGLGYANVREENKVEGGKQTRSASYLGLDLSVGAEFWLNFIDSKSARNLDSSVGINNVYLLVEYFKSRELGAQYANLSREELRLGMRFEF